MFWCCAESSVRSLRRKYASAIRLATEAPINRAKMTCSHGTDRMESSFGSAGSHALNGYAQVEAFATRETICSKYGSFAFAPLRTFQLGCNQIGYARHPSAGMQALAARIRRQARRNNAAALSLFLSDSLLSSL